jgi:hypothetical protein
LRLLERYVSLLRVSTVAEIIDAVRHLSDPEKDEFLARLREVEFEDAWDRQMDADAAAGKLDLLVKEADTAIESGTLRDWPCDRSE